MKGGATASRSTRPISRAITWWDGLENWIADILMACALVLSFYSVVARYILHWPLL